MSDGERQNQPGTNTGLFEQAEKHPCPTAGSRARVQASAMLVHTPVSSPVCTAMETAADVPESAGLRPGDRGVMGSGDHGCCGTASHTASRVGLECHQNRRVHLM